MKSGMMIVAKGLAVILALGLLGFYVWTKQRGIEKPSAASVTLEGDSVFPEMPARPDMFDTSKSGKLEVVPLEALVTGSTSEVTDPLANDALTEKTTPETPVVLMPGSKSINMPVFNTRDVVNGGGIILDPEKVSQVEFEQESPASEPAEEKEPAKEE